MKKLFTLIAVALMTIGASAKTPLTATWSAWGEGCTVEGNTISFTAAWKGAGYWVSADASTSEKLVILLAEEAVGKTKVFFQCKSDCSVSSGDYYIEAGSKILGIDLQSDVAKGSLNEFQQLCVQSTEADCKLVVKEVYLGTTAEYEADLAGNKQQTSPLTLADLGSGWGGSTYDAATKTVTIGDDWTGKGWWLSSANYSDFDQLVIKFDPATEANGNIVIEYNDGVASTKYEFAAGTTTAIIDLDATGKASVKQIYIQGPAASKYVLSAAYVATKEYVAENETTGGETPATPTTLIDYPTKEDGITIGGTCTKATVKIHNADQIPGIKLANSYASEGVVNDNKVELTVDGGFKKGDVITIAGAFNNSDNTKKAAVDLFTLDGTKANVLFTTDQFINGKDKEANPVEQSYTLAADADKLYIGRNGNTNTFVTLLKVVRTSSTGIQQTIAPAKVIENNVIYNLAGQRVNENYKGIVIKNGKKFIQK
ncbi:MAG: hypothetical protein J5952_05335 [Prevotella sp.]|nr:hypothetical protein [Prevotella sp.]